MRAEAAQWAADEEKARPRRRRKPKKPGSKPAPSRRYTAVPRYVRSVVLGAAATGAEARAEANPLTAFRREVKRVGSLLNQALRVIHTWGGREGGKNRAALVSAIEATGRTIARVLENVEARR